MADEMNKEGVMSRRNFLRGVAGVAGGLIGYGIGSVITNPNNAPAQAKPSPTPPAEPFETAKPTATAKPLPEETAAPQPTPEILGDLPDVLSSTDKDWEKYFAKEADLAKINAMIKQQQTEENAKAQAEGREPRVIGILPFDPFETARIGEWTLRKVSDNGRKTYGIKLPVGSILKAPIEGTQSIRGFTNGGRSIDIKGSGYTFWTLHFGEAKILPRQRMIAGEKYLETTTLTQEFRNFGSVSTNGPVTILLAGFTDPSRPFLNLQWLKNDKQQVVFT